MKKPTIKFSIPDFYNLYKLNIILLAMMKKESEKFYDDVEVGSIYGSFPGCIWNSGRAIIGQVPSIDNIINTIKPFNKDFQVGIRFTFTNALIKEQHLNDYYCNHILDVVSDITPWMNGCNVNSECLAKYLEDNYREFYLMWSTTKEIKTVEQFNNLSENRLSVPYYGMNNTSAINEFTHPENVELLVSEACIENCPHRVEHYTAVSKAQLLEKVEPFTCPYGMEQYYYYSAPVKRKHYISIDDIREKYLPLGFNQFKIPGRNDSPINVVENYVNYLARPEYKDEVRNELLISYFRQI